MTEAKVQHYVPKFLIKNFGVGKKGHVWAYDKQAGRSFQSNAKNVASESRFYDFEFDGKSYSLESGLSGIESNTKPIIEKILEGDTISVLEPRERAILSSFLAIQFIRTKAFRQQWAELPKLLREKVELMGSMVAPGSQAEALIREPTENQVKIETTRMILEAPSTYGPLFLSKIWFLAKTTKSHPFMIGDNPVSLQNQVDMRPYGNIGLAVPGIEIYLPLSSTRALVMWCPSLARQFVEAADTIRRLPKLVIAEKIKDPDGILSIDSAIRTGSTLDYKIEHVTNFNSLQVWRSERYVFSSIDDFSLAKKMIEDHPHARVGPRLELG